MMRRIVVGACALALSALAAGSAVAQDAQTITAIGSAQVAVKPRNRTANASIADAVKVASIRAIPLAIAHAREEADHIASAVGLVRGPILSVNENVSPSSPYPPYFVPSFGPLVAVSSSGQYCGTITRPVVRRDASGRRIVRRVKERRCNVPPFASVTVAVTFSATPPPPPSCVVQNGVTVCSTHG